MSNYTKQINWSGKDALPDSDPNKVISGNLFDTEFTAVQTAVNSKAELAGSSTQAFNATTAASTTNTTQVATTAFVTSAVGSITAGFINNLVYPVGAIFTTVNAYADAAAVATTMGVGTWEVFGSGKVLVGVDATQDEFDTVEETGGGKTHTLTEAEIPTHSHTINTQTAPHVEYWGGSETNIEEIRDSSLGDDGVERTEETSDAGSGDAHNNLQPYITVYFWKRTA